MIKKAIIAGGDRQTIGLKNYLKTQGFTKVQHLSSRHHKDTQKISLAQVQLIIVITNYISHAFMKRIRRLAKQQGLPIVFTNRSFKKPVQNYLENQ